MLEVPVIAIGRCDALELDRLVQVGFEFNGELDLVKCRISLPSDRVVALYQLRFIREDDTDRARIGMQRVFEILILEHWFDVRPSDRPNGAEGGKCLFPSHDLCRGDALAVRSAARWRSPKQPSDLAAAVQTPTVHSILDLPLHPRSAPRN